MTNGRMPRSPVLEAQDFNHESSRRSGHSSLGFAPIPASDARASRHEVTVSSLTILHKPPPPGPKELTDLISSLSNCPPAWHAADSDVCVCVALMSK